MIIHLLCTGTELLIGQTLNTNLQFIGQRLAEAGYSVHRETCVGDQAGEIAAALREALATADVVITVGGLGPTSDDLTREAVARELNAPLLFDAAVYQAILLHLGPRASRLPAETLRRQAMVPDNAEPLINRNGTAPGLWCHAAAGRKVVMLPGPPRELQPIFDQDVLPRLQRLAPPEIRRHQFTVCGLPESVVADRVEDFLHHAFPQIEPAYCARLSQVDVRLTARETDAAVLADAARQAATLFGDAVLPPQTGLAATVGELLQRHRLRLAVAESCTGGWIAKTVTDTPGASAWFEGALVTYANRWKEELLGVPATLLETEGAVSEAAADAMIRGLMSRQHVEAGIAVTGIAGPEGGTPEKPVGLVFVATAVHNHCQVEKFQFSGNREGIRQRTVTAALDQLRRQLLRLPTAPNHPSTANA
ncbi:MAG: CinA family nicotinamide mononucleotide deamidase-related protein [Lentisphaeria bacterium]|jgi:nicotinamide-nucleotide amidase